MHLTDVPEPTTRALYNARMALNQALALTLLVVREDIRSASGDGVPWREDALKLDTPEERSRLAHVPVEDHLDMARVAISALAEVWHSLQDAGERTVLFGHLARLKERYGALRDFWLRLSTEEQDVLRPLYLSVLIAPRETAGVVAS